MSNVNVRRLVENIRSGTNIYTPLVELVVNAIQVEAFCHGARVHIW